MGSLQKINGHYYIVSKIRVHGCGRKNIYRKATEEEIQAYQGLADLQKIDLALITCANPECDVQKTIPREQKRDLNTTYPLRYNQFSLVYCSKECREAHSKELEKK